MKGVREGEGGETKKNETFSLSFSVNFVLLEPRESSVTEPFLRNNSLMN